MANKKKNPARISSNLPALRGKSFETQAASLFGNRNKVKSSGPWQAFFNNEWVYAAVKARSEAFAGLTIRLVDQDGEDQEDNIAIRLLMDPNNMQTRYELMEDISIQLSLFGLAYLYIDDSGRDIELRVLNADSVSVKFARDGYNISSYTYKNTIILPENMVVFREPGRSPIDVISAVKASIGSFHMDEFAKLWNERFFINGGAPATIIKLNTDYDEEQFEIVLDKWRTQMAGIKNQGATTVMAEDFEVVKITESPKDIDFRELASVTMQRILATLRVPKTLIGLTEDVNRASAEAAEYTYQKNVNKPSAERFVEKLNQEYIEKLQGALTGTELLTLKGKIFIFDDPVPKDKDIQIKQDDILAKYGAITINELRIRNGLDPIGDDGDILIQRNVAPTVQPEADVETRSFEPQNKKKDTIDLKAWSDRYYGLKTQIGKYFIKRFETSQVLVNRRMVTLFNTQEKTVLKNLDTEFRKTVKTLEKDNIDDALFDVEEEAERFWSKMGPVFAGIMQQEGENATNEIVPGLGQQFDIRDTTSAASQLRKQKQRFAEPVNDTTWDRLRKTLADGVEKGEGINKLKARVKSVYKAAKDFRAVSIARTETLTAANSGRNIGYEELGVEEKIWLSTGDGRTRETHIQADGQTSKNGVFSIAGQEALYPGDASLSPDESVNCRCTIIAKI